MEKLYNEIMQIRVIKEETDLSQMLQDIIPQKENRFTNLELDAGKKEMFSLVVYKQETIWGRFVKNIKLCIEKFKIMKNSKSLQYAKDKLNNVKM